MSRVRVPAALGLLVCLSLCGCGQRATNSPATEEAESEMGLLQVSGPYTHGNLSVFVLRSDKQDEREFLTLDRGLKDGLVKITELDQESVGELKISNESSLPLYLQEGERLIGGKQDRTIAASLVLPPKSGPTVVPTFCIEQGRWQEGDSGRKFGFAVNAALAPKGVRGAAKFEGSQEGVWTAVAAQKTTAVGLVLAPSMNSSANELFDAPKVRKISDEYADALKGALREHPDAVGLALAVNGQIEEVNVYPNHALLSKLYPRLVASYAVQAAMLKENAGSVKSLTSADIAAFLKEGKEKSKQSRTINGSNEAVSRELEDNKFQCATKYDGKAVHWQMMKKNGIGEAGRFRAGALGSKW